MLSLNRILKYSRPVERVYRMGLGIWEQHYKLVLFWGVITVDWYYYTTDIMQSDTQPKSFKDIRFSRLDKSD